MPELEYLTPDEVEQHLYEIRMARWCVLGALVAFWFAAVCAVFYFGAQL